MKNSPNFELHLHTGGGSFPATLGRIEHGFNHRPDLVAVDNKINPKNYLGKFWIDSLVHDKHTLDYVVHLFGSNRVALGSDYPFPLGENIPGDLIRSTNYSDEVKANLLNGSALEWLGMEKRDVF